MNNPRPLVSIGMAIYNEEKHLRSALDSLLAQDYAHFELIISDNASTDATHAISLEYASRDSRVSYHRNETNVGATQNFDRALRLSSGKYFMWAGGHDLWEPSLVSKCVEALEKEPSAVLCYPIVQSIREDGEAGGRRESYVDTRNFGPVRRFNIVVWDLMTCSAIYGMTRSDALKSCRPGRIVFSPDVVLLSELAIRGPFIHLPEVLYYPRDTWRDFSASKQKERMRRMFRDLTGSQSARPVMFPHLHNRYELVQGVKYARVPFWTKCALVLSAVFSYFSTWYRHLPSFMRSPLRSSVRSRLGVFEQSGQTIVGHGSKKTGH